MNPIFTPEEIRTDLPTRSTRLKWVIVVDKRLEPGHLANAVACVAASTGSLVEGLVARGGPDADGVDHAGLPWAGCSVLAAGAEQLQNVRSKALGVEGILVVDMPASAQSNRVYDGYLAELETTHGRDLNVSAVSIVGDRIDVDAIVKRLSLLA